MTTAMTKASDKASDLESVLIQGDLSRLAPNERVAYYQRVCESLGLNPLTKPFEYLMLNGKLILYAKRDCTEQLRKRDGVSVSIVSRELVEGVYVVTARATTADGRTDESIGAVAIDGLKGEARANAMMKAETKAKRRVTLSICGLGMLDETEVHADAQPDPGATPQLPPPSEKSITTAQMRKLHALCNDLGLDRDQRLSLASEVAGRDITTANDLTAGEASALIQRLSDMLMPPLEGASHA